MPEGFEHEEFFPVDPRRLYRAWLSGDEHAAMTGSPAAVDARVGGAFTVRDGYIEGTTVVLEPERRIVQSWRTADFSDADADSRLELLFEPRPGGTLLVLRHTGIPGRHGESCRDGWVDRYFIPMHRRFG